MKTDAERWDEKYRSGHWNQDPTCDAFVAAALEFVGPARGRRALDLASGPGRHALELASRGWCTEAWDVSTLGLELLARRASQAGANVERRLVDLTLQLPTDVEPFDLVLLVNYLDRALFAELGRLLRPGGWLVYATFTKSHTGDHPSPRHCLDSGELKQGLPGLRTERYEEENGRVGILAQREDC